VAKCAHGIYMSGADEAIGKSWGCDACYPDGRPDTESPVLPRSSGDALGRDSARETCKCGNLRTYFSKECRHCGALFSDVDSRSITSQQNTRTNAGACPACRSTIHYETSKVSIWECADCGTKYKAPLGQRRASKENDLVLE
jgi:ribosomal protein L37AE/L43A